MFVQSHTLFILRHYTSFALKIKNNEFSVTVLYKSEIQGHWRIILTCSHDGEHLRHRHREVGEGVPQAGEQDRHLGREGSSRVAA